MAFSWLKAPTTKLCLVWCLRSTFNVKALVSAFNQEKALEGAFSVITKPSCGSSFEALIARRGRVAVVKDIPVSISAKDRNLSLAVKVSCDWSAAVSILTSDWCRTTWTPPATSWSTSQTVLAWSPRWAEQSNYSESRYYGFSIQYSEKLGPEHCVLPEVQLTALLLTLIDSSTIHTPACVRVSRLWSTGWTRTASPR